MLHADADGCYRFNADFANVGALNAELDALAEEYGDEIEAAREPLQSLYEQVFNHQAFTGRSGGMFGFEGLGSIYWHMVSKLLLAVQENFFAALDQGADDADRASTLANCITGCARALVSTRHLPNMARSRPTPTRTRQSTPVPSNPA